MPNQDVQSILRSLLILPLWKLQTPKVILFVCLTHIIYISLNASTIIERINGERWMNAFSCVSTQYSPVHVRDREWIHVARLLNHCKSQFSFISKSTFTAIRRVDRQQIDFFFSSKKKVSSFEIIKSVKIPLVFKVSEVLWKSFDTLWDEIGQKVSKFVEFNRKCARHAVRSVNSHTHTHEGHALIQAIHHLNAMAWWFGSKNFFLFILLLGQWPGLYVVIDSLKLFSSQFIGC